MRKTDVSVIMCNYNYADYISESVESVLKQTHKDFELIVVDDGSRDRSVEVLQQFSDKRLKIICQKNRGQAGAFNRGFKEATGDIIFFIDSDDYWFENKLERVLREHGSHDFVQHRVSINGKEDYPVYSHYENHYELMTEYGISDFFAPTSALSIKRSVLNRVFPLPEEPLRICADAFITRMSLCYADLKCIDDVLSYYRIHGDNFFQSRIKPRNPSFGLGILDVLNREFERAGMPVIPYNNYYNAPEKKWVNLYNIASENEKKGLWDKAAEGFGTVLESKNLNLCSGAFFHLGKIALLKGDRSSALMNLEKCVILNPGHTEGLKLVKHLTMNDV